MTGWDLILLTIVGGFMLIMFGGMFFGIKEII